MVDSIATTDLSSTPSYDYKEAGRILEQELKLGGTSGYGTWQSVQGGFLVETENGPKVILLMGQPLNDFELELEELFEIVEDFAKKGYRVGSRNIDIIPFDIPDDSKDLSSSLLSKRVNFNELNGLLGNNNFQAFGEGERLAMLLNPEMRNEVVRGANLRTVGSLSERLTEIENVEMEDYIRWKDNEPRLIEGGEWRENFMIAYESGLITSDLEYRKLSIAVKSLLLDVDPEGGTVFSKIYVRGGGSHSPNLDIFRTFYNEITNLNYNKYVLNREINLDKPFEAIVAPKSIREELMRKLLKGDEKRIQELMFLCEAMRILVINFLYKEKE